MKRRPVSPYPFLPRSERHNPPWAVAPSQRLVDPDSPPDGPDPAFPSHVMFRQDCESAVEHLASAHPEALALLPCDHLARILVHGRDCGAISEVQSAACLDAARKRLQKITDGEAEGGAA